MLRRCFALALVLALIPCTAQGITITMNGQPLTEAPVYENTTFAPLRSVVSALLPDARVTWEEDRAVVESPGLTLSARPGDSAILCQGETVPTPLPIRLEAGRTLVPIRPLAALLGVGVAWNPQTDTAELSRVESGPSREDDLYWLSRIISAESRGEPWEGQIAVGNVVLNRVGHPDFPDTVYDVIFDDRWGGQFEPVRNGTVYDEPDESCVRAAAACLAGASAAGESLYFLAPELTDNHWIMENRRYVTTIGVHWFYE